MSTVAVISRLTWPFHEIPADSGGDFAFEEPAIAGRDCRRDVSKIERIF
jgi:hypothetical protein